MVSEGASRRGRPPLMGRPFPVKDRSRMDGKRITSFLDIDAVSIGYQLGIPRGEGEKKKKTFPCSLSIGCGNTFYMVVYGLPMKIGRDMVVYGDGIHS